MLITLKNYKFILNKIFESVLTAEKNIETVDLYSSQFDAVNVQHNKWRKTRPTWYNPTAKFILAKSRTTGQIAQISFRWC